MKKSSFDELFRREDKYFHGFMKDKDLKIDILQNGEEANFSRKGLTLNIVCVLVLFVLVFIIVNSIMVWSISHTLHTRTERDLIISLSEQSMNVATAKISAPLSRATTFSNSLKLALQVSFQIFNFLNCCD